MPQPLKTVPAEHAPLRLALLAQLGGAGLVAMLLFGLAQFSQVDFLQAPLLLALLQGGLAAIIAQRQRAPRWWMIIHIVFLPLVIFVHGLSIAPGWFLAAFVLLLLVFWRTDRSRVPLYLTNTPTAEALQNLLPTTPCQVIDLGCGDGGLLRQLARKRPDCRFIGIEHAPLTWLFAVLRALRQPNLTIRYGNFWNEVLDNYDVVYAFLSPAPMPRLWVKACAEMAPAALLVSNSFPVEGAEPEATVRVEDRRETRLFLYHPGCRE
jgi:hypothetical protein